MIDATSVGISPLMSTPMTTYVDTTGVPTTSILPADQTFMNVQSVMPTTTYTTDAISAFPDTTAYQTFDQGFAVPQTTFTTEPVTTFAADPLTTFATEPVTTIAADPLTTFSTQPVTTFAADTTTLLPETAMTSFVPETTLPDQALASFAPTDIVTTPTYSVIPDAGVQSVVASTPVELSSVVPSVVVPEVPAASSIVSTPSVISPPTTSVVPQVQSSTTGPILDEDFQRGRPIYDEFSEDRYRGFKFGR